MIFLTVGDIFPFDRLVKAVDEAVEAGVVTMPVFAQIGRTDYKPRNMNYAQALEKAQFDRKVDEAAFVISHAGIGSLLIALEQRKRLLVMPRMRQHGEAANDHQMTTARRFASLGYILAAYNSNELPEKLREIESFTPAVRQNEASRVAGRLSQFIDQVTAEADRGSPPTFHRAPSVETRRMNRSGTP